MANITDQLEQSIANLEEAMEIESPTWKEIKDKLLPDRAMAKNMMMSIGFSEVQAHAICYGHTDLDSTEVRYGALNVKSEIMKSISKMKEDLKRAVNILYKESVRVGKVLAELTKESAMAISAIANALATVPPQPAVALYTAQQYNTKVTDLLDSFSESYSSLGILSNVSLMVSETMLVVVLTPIIALIDTITIGVTAIKALPKISA